MTAPAPLVSIVTTLEYPRERPVECLESWIQQTLPEGAQTELIVVASGRHRWFERQVPAILRPQDQIIRLKTRDEMAMYHAGVQAAKGTWIMFTEPHCVAEPECLATLIRYSETHDLAGACVRTLPTPLDRHRMIRMEAILYEEAAAIWTKEGDWRKFTKRGTLVKKSAYLAAGGFPKGHLRYGETTLAARLHEMRLTLGYTPDAAITHYNPTDMGELLGYVWEFRRKEREVARTRKVAKGTISRAEADPALAEAFAASNAMRRHVRDLVTRKEMAHMADLPPIPGKGLLLWQRMMQVPRIAFEFVATWLKFKNSGLSEEAAYAIFKRVWQTYGDLSVALQGPLRDEAHPLPRRIEAGQPCHVGEMDAAFLAGCHALEHHEGTDFRWTAPISLWRFKPMDQVPQVTLEFIEARPLKAREIRLWWNRTPLVIEKDASRPGHWVFAPKDGQSRRGPVPGENDDLLVIFCPPVQGNAEDPRQLGLALKSVTVQASPVVATTRTPHVMQPAPGSGS